MNHNLNEEVEIVIASRLVKCMVFTTNIVLFVGVRSGSIKRLSDHIASTGGWMAWSTDVLLRRPARSAYHYVLKPSMSWAYSKLFAGADDVDDFCRPKTAEQIVSSLPDEQFVFIDLVQVTIPCTSDVTIWLFRFSIDFDSILVKNCDFDSIRF